MLCGNDPRAHASMAPETRAMLAWFRSWLEWSALPAAQRKQISEPIAPGATHGVGLDLTEMET